MNRTVFFDRKGIAWRGYDPILTFSRIVIFASAAIILYQLANALAVYVTAMVPVMDYADKRLMLILNFAGPKEMDNFMYAYSQRLTWVPLMITAAATIVAKHPGKTKDKIIFAVTVGILIISFDQISSSIIKPLACRLRPSHDPSISCLLHYVNGYHGGRFGFVSSHAANNVGIATMLCMIFKDRLTRFTLVLFAAIMCYSRIYLGVHYPGDVLCGALLGWAIAYASFRFLGSRIHVYSTTERPTLMLLVFYSTLVIIQ